MGFASIETPTSRKIGETWGTPISSANIGLRKPSIQSQSVLLCLDIH